MVKDNADLKKKNIKTTFTGHCENKSYTNSSYLISSFELAQFIFGLLIFNMIHTGLAIAYFVFFLIVAIYFYDIKCRNCYYFGRECVDGRLAKLLFKTENEPKKSIRLISTKRSLIILDYLKALLPVVGALYIATSTLEKGLLLAAFYFLSWIIISNLLVRRKCICCEQRKLSCGANQASLTLVKKEAADKNNRDIQLNIVGLFAIYLWVILYIILPAFGINF